MYEFLKNRPALVIILLSAAISFTSKAPNGLASLRPPEIAAWLATGLSPEQQAALLEAEKRRLEQALAQQQLTKAEIKALEKTGAFATRPTAQELEERLDELRALLKGDLDDYGQARDVTLHQFQNLLNRMTEIIKAETNRTPGEVQKIRQALRPELQTIYDQVLKIKDDFEEQQDLLETIILDAEEFLQTIPPYPELGDVRGRARETLDSIRQLYNPGFLENKLKHIKIIQEIINKMLENA